MSQREFLKRIANLPSTIKYYTSETAIRYHVRDFKEKHPNFQLPIFHKYLLVRFYLTSGYHSSFFNFLREIILKSPAGSYQCHTDFIPTEFKHFLILLYPGIQEDYEKFYRHFLENYNFKLFDFININYDNMNPNQFLSEAFCECKDIQDCPIPRKDENQKYIYPYDLLGDLLYLDPGLTESDNDDEVTIITASPSDSDMNTTTDESDGIVHSPCIINNIEDFHKKRKRSYACTRDAKLVNKFEKWSGIHGDISGEGYNDILIRKTRSGKKY
jgi:hypothetical protein